MKAGFWVSFSVFILTVFFFFLVTFIDCGINIQFPKGIPDNTPNVQQMRDMVEALRKYMDIDGIVSFISFVSSGVLRFVTYKKDIPLT